MKPEYTERKATINRESLTILLAEATMEKIDGQGSEVADALVVTLGSAAACGALTRALFKESKDAITFTGAEFATAAVQAMYSLRENHISAKEAVHPGKSAGQDSTLYLLGLSADLYMDAADKLFSSDTDEVKEDTNAED